MFEALDLSEWVQIASSFFGAFFAFVFFIIGEKWLANRRAHTELIEELFSVKYYLANLHYYFEMNLAVHPTILAGLAHDSITRSKLLQFPIRESSWKILRNCKVAESIERTYVFLKVINNDIEQYNELVQTFSRFAEVAAIENKQDAFRESMTKNIEKFKADKQKIPTLLKDHALKLNGVIDEVDFTLNYLQYFLPKRLYYRFRIKLDPSFRDLCIQKAHAYKTNE